MFRDRGCKFGEFFCQFHLVSPKIHYRYLYSPRELICVVESILTQIFNFFHLMENQNLIIFLASNSYYAGDGIYHMD